MPSLLDLANNLSNFKYYSGVGTFSANKVPYGKDTVTGGDSGQPYIVNDKKKPSLFGIGASLRDVKRISKFLLDKTKGVEFTLKQVGLQLMNVKLENRARDTKKDVHKQGIIKNVSNFASNQVNRILNDIGPTRIYNPLNTHLLAQVAGSAFGVHIVRHGLSMHVNEADKYTSIVKANNEVPGSLTNRLIRLTREFAGKGKDGKRPIDNDLIDSYRGGPNSFLGIGKTVIRKIPGISTVRGLHPEFNKEILNGFIPRSSSEILETNKNVGRESFFKESDKNTVVVNNNLVNLTKAFADFSKQSKAEGLSTFQSILDKKVLNGFIPTEINDVLKIGEEGKIVSSGGGTINTKDNFDFINSDFRAYKKLQNPDAYKNTTIYSEGLAADKTVRKVAYEARITDYSKYNKYERIGVINSNAKRFGNRRHDGINMVGLYYGPGKYGLRDNLKDINDKPVEPKNIRDLIKFRIKSIDNDSPDGGVFMIFRAFFNGAITDSVDANFKAINYAGRGESFYGYEGTTSTMSFSFTMVAFSREEMKPLYQKLNYLKSTLYPDYSANRMRGNLSELTIGDYIKYQPGIITSMTITIPEETNWEIAMTEPDPSVAKSTDPLVAKETVKNLDADMHELPMMVKVDLTFIPIYNFLPRKSSEAAFIGIDSTSPNEEIKEIMHNGGANPQEWLKGSSAKLK